MQNLIFKGLIGQFKIAATTQYITRIKDSTKNPAVQMIPVTNMYLFYLHFYYFTITHNENIIIITFQVHQ